MKKFKSIVAVVLLVAIVLALFTGCSKTSIATIHYNNRTYSGVKVTCSNGKYTIDKNSCPKDLEPYATGTFHMQTNLDYLLQCTDKNGRVLNFTLQKNPNIENDVTVTGPY